MSTTLKISLQRLRQIVAININAFAASGVVGLVILLVTAFWNPESLGGKNLPTIHHGFVAFTIAIFGLIPIAILIQINVSKHIRGVDEVRLNVDVAKRSLFISLGFLWISTFWLVCTAISRPNVYKLTELIAGVFALVSWYLVSRIAITYVKG
jgi:hypothetical protein